MIELRLMTAIAVRHKRVLKSGDVKQAFVQATLPDDEIYVVRPPKRCLHTHPQEFWKLNKPLYGLRRAPRHWYNKFRSILVSLNLQPCKNAPCIFHGKVLPDKPPLYLGVYVDDFIYFSESPSVEKAFEDKLTHLTDVDFLGTVTHFLGTKFTWIETPLNDLTAHLSQQAFIDNLILDANLDPDSASNTKTPYRSGLPIDSIPSVAISSTERDKLKLQMQQLMGSLQWVSHCTRPDISTATALLSKYQNSPSPGHLQAAKHIIKYLKSTSTHGIRFTSSHDHILQSFLHFPDHRPRPLTGISDANWGAQDQSLSHNTNITLDLHKSRSISEHIIILHPWPTTLVFQTSDYHCSFFR